MQLATASLQQRLAQTLLRFGITPLLVFGVLIALGDYHIHQNQGIENTRSLSREAAVDLDLVFSDHKGAVSQVAGFLRNQPDLMADPVQLKAFLDSTREGFPRFHTMLIAGTKGDIIAAGPSFRTGDLNKLKGNVADRPYFSVAATRGISYASGVFEGRGFGNDLLCAVSSPIVLNDGRFLGIVQGSVLLEQLNQNLASSIIEEKKIDLLILDSSGRVAFRSANVPFELLESVREHLVHLGVSKDSTNYISLKLKNSPLSSTLVSESGTKDGWRVIAMTSYWSLLLRVLLDIALMLLVLMVTLALSWWGGLRYGRKLVVPLNTLAQQFDALSLEETPSMIEGRSHLIEIRTLQNSFFRMVERVDASYRALQQQIVKEEKLRTELARAMATQQAAENELAIARNIQLSMVPPPQSLEHMAAGLDVAAVFEPAKAVGGDFYNVIMLDESYLCVFVGDVSGKGVSAALFMARVATLLGVASRSRASPGALLASVGYTLASENPSHMFATVLCVVIDLSSGTVVLSSAGHDPPLYLRADGTSEKLTFETGPALGFETDAEYPEWSTQMSSGDGFLCFTDGITESPDAAGVEFGEVGVSAVIKTTGAAAKSSQLLTQIARALHQHTGNASPFDDVTAVCLRWTLAQSQDSIVWPTIDFSMSNNFDQLSGLLLEIDSWLAEQSVSQEKRTEIQIVTEEVLTNTVRHGYLGQQEDLIVVALECSKDSVTLSFDDGARAFDPLAQELPDLDMSIEDRPIGGLGVFLVRELSQAARYQRVNDRNVFEVVINLTK